jgi:hypothetical protein
MRPPRNLVVARSSSLVFWEENPARYAPKSNSFKMGSLSPLARSGRDIPGMGCMVPQPFFHWRE